MGSLFSTFDTALSGLHTAQTQISVAGHNIANVNKEGFSRQRAELVSKIPFFTMQGQIGRGVGVGGIRQVRDKFLDNLYHRHAPSVGKSEVQARFYTMIEGVLQEPSDNAFGNRLDIFYSTLSDYANDVEGIPVREALLAEAWAMTSALNDAADRLYELRTNANEEVKNIVDEINPLAKLVADLNNKILQAEMTGTEANDLRDDRNLALDKLSALVNITVRERDDGRVDVLLGSDILVSGNRTRELAAVRNAALDPDRDDLLEVRFLDNDALADIKDGELFGALESRDTILVETADSFDRIAAALISGINGVHNQGNGLQNLSGTISSANAAVDSTTPLISAGLPFPVVPGSFDVVVYDAAGVATTTTVTITDTTTLDDLAATLNAIPNFSAGVVDGETLALGTSDPFTFSFANDGTGTLTALGVNGFFTGDDARSITVNSDLQENPEWITSGFSLEPADTGDNTAALAMANVRNSLTLGSKTSTIDDFYESMLVVLGVEGRTNLQDIQVNNTFLMGIDQRRLEVSGVSLDEEITFMIEYQRAYEASARVISTVDRLLDTLLNMIR